MNSEHDYQSTAHQADGYIHELSDEWLDIPDPVESRSLRQPSASRPNQRRLPPAQKRSIPIAGAIAAIIARIQLEVRKRRTTTPLERADLLEYNSTSGYNRHFYHNKGTTTPWWIIIASWLVIGLPTLLLSIHQLSKLLHTLPETTDSGVTPVSFTLPLAIVCIIATFIIFYILGRQTARRIRTDRRQERFRRYTKEREAITVGTDQ